MRVRNGVPGETFRTARPPVSDMSRRNPFDDIEEFFDRMMGEFDTGGTAGLRSVPVDVAETADEVTVTADLPGYDTEDIDVSIADRTLTVRATREAETSDESERYHRRERRRNEVSRSVRLPADVEEESADATYTNGVLTVTIPKRGGDGHQIEVE